MEATTGPIALVATDYIELVVFQSSDGNLSINDNNASDLWLACVRLGD